MKSNPLQIKLSVLLILAAAPCARPQGTFVNLDFESANIQPGQTPGFVAASDALPGWTCTFGANGTNQALYVLYDTVPLNDAGISIHDANGTVPVLQGNYSVLLSPNNPIATIFPAIAQVGTIPSGARSLQFYDQYGIPTVLFGGQQLGLVTLATTPTYKIFGADITPYAGQTGELRFTEGALLDNIVFSNEAVPEPGAVGLIAFGVAAAAIRRRRRRA